MKNVVVIGGGAAGMMAAIRSASLGHKVILLEQNEKLGKKLFITGKGRCNLTNACDISDLFSHVISKTYVLNRILLFYRFHWFMLQCARLKKYQAFSTNRN